MPAPGALERDDADPRRGRAALSVLVVAWGVQAIVTQSLLLREALVLMFGSEIAWGVVLFAWLLGVAVGAAVGGWVANRVARADAWLALVLLLLSVTACLELALFRSARGLLGVGPGELLPLPKTILAAALFVSPASALVGMAFPLASCVTRAVHADQPHPHVLSLGAIYALESAGSLAGGAIFSFWAVEHLNPVHTALVSGAITTAATASALGRIRQSRLGAAGLGLACVAFLLIATGAGDALNRVLINQRWDDLAPGYELCAETESKYQNLAVGRRAGQYTLYCDGQVTADFPDPYTYAPLAHFWMCQHPAPENVLLLGGGAEGLLAEILQHPVRHVDYVETDARQIELIKPFLGDVDRRALLDERVTVHHIDARYFIKTQAARYDLVIARLPEPMSALRARFYTTEFFGELRNAMTERSVLCTTVAATPGSLMPASAEYLASLHATIQPHFPQIIIGWGHPAHLLAATDRGLLTTDPAALAGRYVRRGVESELFHPAWFEGATDWLAPDKLRQRAAEIEAVDNPQVSTDLKPAIYMQRLALWESAVREPTHFIERLRAARWGHVVAALLLLAGLTVAWCRFRSPARNPGRSWPADAAVVLSIGSTGFVTMALSIVWLFAFQNLYGYVYQRIGWILALFMGGLVIGCGAANRYVAAMTEAERAPALPDYARRLWSWLIGVDAGMAALALMIPWLLRTLGGLPAGPGVFALVEVSVSIMVAMTGVLGGAAFAVAAKIRQTTTEQAGAVAGTIVGADHAGACLGALFCGILLVPVFGTPATAYLLAAIKLGSAALLLTARRRCARSYGPLQNEEVKPPK
jgi:spermidine synthase